MMLVWQLLGAELLLAVVLPECKSWCWAAAQPGLRLCMPLMHLHIGEQPGWTRGREGRAQQGRAGSPDPRGPLSVLIAIPLQMWQAQFQAHCRACHNHLPCLDTALKVTEGSL